MPKTRSTRDGSGAKPERFDEPQRGEPAGRDDLDPDGPMPNPRGLDVPVLPPAPDGVAKGARLQEIM